MPKSAPVLLLLADCRALVQVQQLVISLARPASAFFSLLCSAVYSNFTICNLQRGVQHFCFSTFKANALTFILGKNKLCCFKLSFNYFFRTPAAVAYVPGCCRHISAYTQRLPPLSKCPLSGALRIGPLKQHCISAAARGCALPFVES